MSPPPLLLLLLEKERGGTQREGAEREGAGRRDREGKGRSSRWAAENREGGEWGEGATCVKRASSHCRLPPSRGSKGRRAHSAPAGDRHDSCSQDPAGCAPGYAQSARARQPLPAAAQTPRGPCCTAWSPRDHAAAHSRHARTAGSRPTWAEPLPAVQAMSAVTVVAARRHYTAPAATPIGPDRGPCHRVDHRGVDPCSNAS